MTTGQLTGTTVRMPALGEGVDEGTVTRWLKQPGDHVTADEPLLEVATDKVDTEIPSPVTGVLQRILAGENDVVAVGADLAVITEPGTGSADTPPTPPVSAPAADPTTPAAAASPVPVAAASPLRPSPPEPRIPAQDASRPQDHAGSDGSTVEKLPRIRRTIARRMVDSLQTAAQLTTVLEVDVTAIARLRAAHKDEFYQRTGIKLSFLPFFAKAPSMRSPSTGFSTPR